jgi:hypothetical protein
MKIEAENEINKKNKTIIYAFFKPGGVFKANTHAGGEVKKNDIFTVVEIPHLTTRRVYTGYDNVNGGDKYIPIEVFYIKVLSQGVIKDFHFDVGSPIGEHPYSYFDKII